jgi:CRP-like cAMP-binding protein
VYRLRAIPEFAGLDERTLLKIVGASANLFWRAGEHIEQDEGLFVVLDGRVRVVDDDGRAREVGPGGSFGELSLFPNGHAAGARAIEDAELMVVPKAWLGELNAAILRQVLRPRDAVAERAR